MRPESTANQPCQVSTVEIGASKSSKILFTKSEQCVWTLLVGLKDFKISQIEANKIAALQQLQLNFYKSRYPFWSQESKAHREQKHDNGQSCYLCILFTKGADFGRFSRLDLKICSLESHVEKNLRQKNKPKGKFNKIIVMQQMILTWKWDYFKPHSAALGINMPHRHSLFILYYCVKELLVVGFLSTILFDRCICLSTKNLENLFFVPSRQNDSFKMLRESFSPFPSLNSPTIMFYAFMPWGRRNVAFFCDGRQRCKAIYYFKTNIFRWEGWCFS